MDRLPKITTTGGSSTALLLSIKSEHADRIFNGSKHYELRKLLPKEKFSRVFLYETGGIGVVGFFEVGEVLRKPVNELWSTVGEAATTRARFFEYFSNCKDGYAIEIREPFRFKSPLSVKRLNGDFTRLVPPQSFLLLDPGQPLRTILEAERTTTLRANPPTVALRNISKNQHEMYRSLVSRYIGTQYDDIDATFAEANLRIHQQGFDPAGFFTTRKQVLSVYGGRGALVGFTTLTFKSGGSLKTGPTILLRQFRGRGLGAAIRRAMEKRALQHSCRKIYCTCPDTAEATIRYLLASGMRIEAHLERHYAIDHDELVFGKLLVADKSGQPFSNLVDSKRGKVVPPTAFAKRRLIADLMQMFRDTWSAVPRYVAKTIVEQSLQQAEVAHDKKPKRLVCLQSGENCVAAVALLPKRGGAVKGVLFRSTSHMSGIQDLLRSAEVKATTLKGRKLYFLHPLLDSPAILLMRQLGFRAEGLLRAPYKPGQDVIVLSKFL